ncbi:hypothetical protein [Modestobacter sp. NPDC049651]|uniref:hypothetical protein n=1 Tax=unclassified Modestobacter TaxID=2643866 RepID=UPI0033D4CC02
MLFGTDRHPTEGTLRRLVDDPAGVADADRAHVADCPVCLAGVAAAQDDARAVATALTTDVTATDVSPDVDRAWARLRTSTAPAPAAAPRARRRRVRAPLAAAVGAAVVLGGAGVAAAADWLPVFRTEQVAPVQVRTADLVALPDLSAYGDLRVLSEPDVRTVGSAAAAEDAAGLDLPQVRALPGGVTGDPEYSVGDQVVAEFTFSAAKAATAAGAGAPPVPAGLDGSTFRLTAGPGVAQTWRGGASGAPALVVARVTAPTAFSDGVPFDTARDYLLSLPGLPADLAAQLRGFTADGTTLPLPVPADLATTSTTEVDGHSATVVATRDGSVTGVVWVADGVVTAVGGSLSEDEVLAVARDLR